MASPRASSGGGDGSSMDGNFTQIQSRRFRRGTSLPCWALCPSMDLVAVGTRHADDHSAAGAGGAGGSHVGGGRVGGGAQMAESIAVHRLLSWQGLLALKSERLTSRHNDDEEEGVVCVEDLERPPSPASDDNSSSSEEEEVRGAASACWSPDGRSLAVGLADGGIAIHTVEPDAAAGGTDGSRDGEGRRPWRALKPPPPSLHPSPSPSISGGRSKAVMPSPRVTRSMAAAREGGGANPTARGASRSRSRSRSQSPGKRSKNNPFPNAVVGLAWGRLAPANAADDKERERREARRHGQGLVERGSLFLPPGTYPPNQSPSTPEGLTLLCVANRQEAHWYLQGRYRILSVAHGLGPCANGVELVCSPDLSTVLAVAKPPTTTVPSSPRKARSVATPPMKAKLFCANLIPQKRCELQLLAASYTSIFAHLHTAQRGIESSLQAWKSAVRPLDAKFAGLCDILSRYGPDANPSKVPGPNEIRSELLQFILAGGSTATSDTSSALDQFFTRATMHDQLLTREIRNVEAGAAATESALRGKVMGAVRAAVYETEELYGLAVAQQGGSGQGEEGLVDPRAALRLYASARVLYLTFEQCLGCTVEARSRLRDLLAWMRGAASQVRARGTAADGAQRRNARDRRAPDGAVRRVAAFLSGPMACASSVGEERQRRQSAGYYVEKQLRRTLAEGVIGVPLSDFLGEESTSPSGTESTAPPPPPPRGTRRVRSLATAVRSILRLGAFVFDQPRGVLARSVEELDLCFDEPHSVVATHARIGAGPNAGSAATGFFVPKLYQRDGTDDKAAEPALQEGAAATDPSIEESPFWMLLARSTGEVGYSILELIAIPGSSAIGPEPNESFYLRTEIRMPDCAEIVSLAFYGDNGISSLSPNLSDDAATKEGWQSLGLVVRPNDLGKRRGMGDEELWLFPYDGVAFRKVQFEKGAKNEVAVPTAGFANGEASFVCLTDDEIDSGCPYTVPKRRALAAHRKNSPPQPQQASQVDLCGSRGTGGVVAFGASTFLTVFDLEEDEDDGASSAGDDGEEAFEEE